MDVQLSCSQIVVSLASAVAGLAPMGDATGQTRPAVEFGSLLDDIRILGDSQLSLGRFGKGYVVAFLPGTSEYDPLDLARSGGHRFWASVRKGGREIGKTAFHVQRFGKVFARAYSCPDSSVLRKQGFSQDIRLQGSGRYEIVFFVDDQASTRIAFDLEVERSNDPFQPGSRSLVDGPWKNLARLVRLHGRDKPQVAFEMWAQSRTRKPDQYEVRVRHDGEVVAISGRRTAATEHWTKLNFALRYPRGLGRGVFTRSDLLRRDGRYDVAVTKNGRPFAVWSFEAKAGKVVASPRQKLGYAPHGDWLLPRGMDFEKHFGFAYDWLQRAAEDAAVARTRAAPRSTPISASVRNAWIVQSKQAKGANGPVLTQCTTRGDAAIAVGDGVIAFGTGGYSGVSWMRCGDEQPRSVPRGQEFLAKLLGACGHKLVFVDRTKSVSVFDSATGKLETLPPETITLGRLFGGPNKSSAIAYSGRLAFLLCDPTRVTDRRMFKVLDLSQAEPRVYSMRNAEGLLPRDVSDIAIDAARGQVAISSKRQAKVWTGTISIDGELRAHELKGHDGVSDGPIQLSDGNVVYRDSASRRLARMLDTKTGSVAAPTAPTASLPRTQSGTRGTNGGFYRAGTGSIGSGELLEVLRGGKWARIQDGSGRAIPASDVTAGPGLIAFKHGKGNRVSIGFLPVGSRP